MNNPIFVDLNGSTARVDPQRTQTAYLKLTLCTEQQSDEAGNLVSRGRVAEVWITAK